MTQLNQLKLSDAMKAIEAMFDAPSGHRRPIFLSGQPGIGKTLCFEQIAAKRGVKCVILTAPLEDPITLSGLPARSTEDPNYAEFLTFRDKLPTSGEGFLVLDELPTAPASVQTGFNSLLLAGTLGSYRLPAGYYVAATGNRTTDRASANRIPTPVQSRLVELSIMPDLDDWIAWGLDNNIRPEVIAFLSWRRADPADGVPDMFNGFDPSRPGPFQCPRTWHIASDILDRSLPPMIEQAMLAGTVGDGPAGELVAFLLTYRSLVSPDLILMQPATADIPTELSALHSVCGALAAKATEANFDRVMVYLDRLPAEFVVMAVDRAARRLPILQHTKAFGNFARKYDRVMN
jgi:hypothetical protein